MNIGDGFILRAVERLFGRVPEDRLFSTWEALPKSGLARLSRSRALISAGANQLNDRYCVLPGMTPEDVESLDCPIVLVGIGIHGVPDQNRGMSEDTKAILKIIHGRVPHSSWRCPHTIAYLERELPELKGRMLMTGCPVIYDRPLLEGAIFARGHQTVAVTTTERGDFVDREVATLRFVARQFPASRRYLVTHQNFAPPGPLEATRHRLWPRPDDRPPAELRRQARKLGFEIFIPRTADEALRFYGAVDLHIGSRLHAHLHFLSQAKWSFVTYVDERITGIAEAFGFPVCDANHLADYLDFDFELLRIKAVAHFETMRRFVDSMSSLQVVLGEPANAEVQ